jgi:hypothetical protein
MAIYNPLTQAASGYELPDAAKWNVVIPEESYNLYPYPSYEYPFKTLTTTPGTYKNVYQFRTLGAGTASFNIDNNVRYSGPSSLRIDNNAAGSVNIWFAAFAPLLAATSGPLPSDYNYLTSTDITISFYARVSNAAAQNTIQMQYSEDGYNSALVTLAFAQLNQWQKFIYTFKTSTNPTSGEFYLGVPASVSLWLDTVQVENKSYDTTYFDGDTEGCRWLGEPGASISYRPATGYGGRVYSIKNDLLITIIQETGTGFMPFKNIGKTSGISKKEIYERTVFGPRVVTLTGILEATSLEGLAQKKRFIEELLAPYNGLYANRPLLLQQKNNSVEIPILEFPCRLEASLFEKLENGFTEQITLVFKEFDNGAIYNPVNKAVNLPTSAALTFIGSASSRSYHRSPLDPYYRTITYFNPTTTTSTSVARIVAMGRNKGNVTGLVPVGIALHGVTNQAIGYYSPYNLFKNSVTANLNSVNVFQQQASATTNFNGYINAAISAQNTNYFAGAFTSPFSYICYQDNAASTVTALPVGTTAVTGPTGIIRDMEFNPYNKGLYVVGDFTSPYNRISIYDRTTFGWIVLLSTGANNVIRCITQSPTNERVMYIGGDFTSFDGVAVNYVCQINAVSLNSSMTLTATIMGNSVSNGTNGTVNSIVATPDGSVYIGGTFTQAMGTTVNYVARWNGSQWVAVGTGLPASVKKLVYKEDENAIYANVNLATTFTGLRNGVFKLGIGTETWLPVDFNNTSSGLAAENIFATKDSIVLSYNGIGGNIDQRSYVQVPYLGTADSYPEVTITGPGYLRELYNQFTGVSLYFDYYIEAGERVVLDFTGLARGLGVKFTSSWVGDILYSVLNVLDLDRFVLLHRNESSQLVTNYHFNNAVGLFMTNTTGNTKAFIEYRNQFHSFNVHNVER